MLIDEKGRIFGKVNIIDFLVLCFLIALLPTLYFGYKMFTRPLSLSSSPLSSSPTITLDNVEYEKEIAQYKEEIAKYKQKMVKVEAFLKEHRRARKYFE